MSDDISHYDESDDDEFDDDDEPHSDEGLTNKPKLAWCEIHPRARSRGWRSHAEDRGRYHAMIRNSSTNPSSSGDAYFNKRHFKVLVAELCRMAPAGHGDSTQQPTIYMVPHELKVENYNPVGEYEPLAVALGNRFTKPSQYREGLTKLEKYKWYCARQLISRHSSLLEPVKTMVLLHGCIRSIMCVVPQVRASYSQANFMSAHTDGEIVKMMLKDGCFILHRLLKYARRAKMEAGDGKNDRLDDYGEDDEDWTQVYGRCGVWQLVTRDLLLLENQIPFPIIRELFQHLRNEEELEDLLVTGSLRLFRSLRPQMLHSSPIQCGDVHHLLHLFYLSVGLPPTDRQQQQRGQSEELLSELPQWIPCAKELEEAGVRFRKRKNATSFLDIKFARGTLEIPQLELNDSSESLFRNLIAFEQTYPDTPRDVSTYAVFMNCLVTSPEDMRILDLHGILVNHLSRRGVAWRFFSDIVAQVHWSTDNYLVGVMKGVNRYRERRRHKWRAALARNYFSNPWVTMSVLAALLLLAMAVLQTFFTAYAYFKPPSPN